jgi:hypothetical protein
VGAQIFRPGIPTQICRCRYGWSGGYGTTWFNDPNRGRIAIALTQVSDFLFNGGLTKFNQLAAQA